MITVAYSLVTYHVTGLTPESCAHCTTALKTELIQVPGVVGVEVNLAEQKISVLTDGPVEEALIRTAVDEAGCGDLQPAAR